LADRAKILMAIFSRHFELERRQLFSGNRSRKRNLTVYVNSCGGDDIPFGIEDEGELHGVLTLIAVNRSSVNLPLRPREVYLLSP